MNRELCECRSLLSAAALGLFFLFIMALALPVALAFTLLDKFRGEPR